MPSISCVLFVPRRLSSETVLLFWLRSLVVTAKIFFTEGFGDGAEEQATAAAIPAPLAISSISFEELRQGSCSSAKVITVGSGAV